MKVSFSKAAAPAGAAIIVPVFEDGEPTKAMKALDKATDGALLKTLENDGFKGAKGKTATLVGLEGSDASRIVVVGAGKRSDFTLLDAEAVGGAGAGIVLKTKDKTAVIAADGFTAGKLTAGDVTGARELSPS
ncbi:MAG: M17 family peptidase N-terminal domain-containing protein [Parvularculaceae bacterium]